MNKPFTGLKAVIIALGWLSALWGCVHMLTPPESIHPATAAGFSVERAQSHLKRIAAAPHPAGSAAHRAVAGYLLEQIASFGYRAEIQSTVAASPATRDTPYVRAAPIQNVLVRVPGTAHQGAVLVAAHYDSAESSPGAADDGAAVAAMLETLRSLKSDRPPQNDLIFLFTDAEEIGLLGSRSFVERHPFAKDCKIALNFEARGNRGVLLMFETSPGNAALVEHYRRAAVQPVASSLMYSVYRKLLQNDTDFSVFRQAGMAGMNFAFIDGWTDYHTRLDNPDRLNTRTLALQGENLLRLTRHFAEADLASLGNDREAGYFNLPFGGLFAFPLNHRIAIAICSLLLTGFVLRALAEACRCRQTFVFYGIQASILITEAGGVIGANFGLHAALMHAHPGYRWLSEPYNAAWYFFAACALSAAIFTFLHRILARWTDPQAYAAMAIMLWLSASVYLAWAFPGGVFFALIPALAMTVVQMSQRLEAGLGHACITAISSFFVIGTVGPTLYLAHLALGFHADAWLTAIIALSLSLLAPALTPLLKPLGWRLPAGLLAIALVMVLQAERLADFSRERPRPNSLIYAWDGASRSARWLSYDPEPDAWTRQVLGASPAVTRNGIFDSFAPQRRMLERKAPFVPMSTAELHVAAPRFEGENHSLDVRIQSRRKGSVLRVGLQNAEKLLAIDANGQTIYRKTATEPSLRFVELHGFNAEEVKLTFTMAKAGRIKMLEIIEICRDLSQINQEIADSRPENTMPARSSSLLPVDAVVLRQFFPL